MLSTKISDFFKTQPILAAYLFGSQATGKVGPLSDYDFGIWLDFKVAKSRYFDLQIELLNKLSLFLKTDKIDVVILNQANSNLAMSVIRGKLLYEKEAELRIEFEVKVMKEYLDREYYEKRFAEYLKKSILSNYGRTKTTIG